MSPAVYALLGDPVAQSPSPAFQSAALRAAGIDAEYVARPTKEAELPELVDALRQGTYAGFNVTIPLKIAIMSHLDRVSAAAQSIGAVNTVCRLAAGDVVGHNTDAPGFADALRAFNHDGAPGSALIFGAGGAARAAAWQLVKDGWTVTVGARRIEQAQDLADAWGGVEAAVLGSSIWVDRARGASLWVNALPVAAGGEYVTTALADGAHPPRIAMDLAYAIGRATPFVRALRAVGGRAEDGAEMLLHQGARAFELWHGRPMPMEEARAALTGALAHSLATSG